MAATDHETQHEALSDCPDQLSMKLAPGVWSDDWKVELKVRGHPLQSVWAIAAGFLKHSYPSKRHPLIPLRFHQNKSGSQGFLSHPVMMSSESLSVSSFVWSSINSRAS